MVARVAQPDRLLAGERAQETYVGSWCGLFPPVTFAADLACGRLTTLFQTWCLAAIYSMGRRCRHEPCSKGYHDWSEVRKRPSASPTASGAGRARLPGQRRRWLGSLTAVRYRLRLVRLAAERLSRDNVGGSERVLLHGAVRYPVGPRRRQVSIGISGCRLSPSLRD